MKRADKVIFVLSLCFSLVLAFVQGNAVRKENKICVISVNGEIYGSYDFGSIKKPKSLEINTKYGYNKVVIDSSGVVVTETNCPDKLEEMQGKISNCGEMLVCLPNRLVIRIEGKDGVFKVAY